MSESTQFSRRHVLRLIAAVGLTPAALASCIGSFRQSLLIEESFFAAMDVDTKTLKKFVAAFDQSNGTYPSQAMLEREMFGRQFTGRSDDEIKTWLRDRIAQDFASSRTVKLDGWVLSHTEVQTWAIYLLHSTELRERSAG